MKFFYSNLQSISTRSFTAILVESISMDDPDTIYAIHFSIPVKTEIEDFSEDALCFVLYDNYNFRNALVYGTVICIVNSDDRTLIVLSRVVYARVRLICRDY
jgi:hypothetical protein